MSHIIYVKSIGLPDDFNRIRRDPLSAMFYFTVFCHERAGTNPNFQKYHRVSIRRALIKSKEHVDGTSFSSALKSKEFPEKVWKEFRSLVKQAGSKPNAKITIGPVYFILKEMQGEKEPNIIRLLEKKGIVGAHEFLRKIQGIGDKVSALILRDFQSFLSLWQVPKEERWRLQPVDRWVRRFSELCWPNEFSAYNKRAKGSQMALLIVECCENEKINPISFNQGAWFVGNRYTELCKFHGISEEESLNLEECIMKFNEEWVASAIKKFGELKEKGEIFTL